SENLIVNSLEDGGDCRILFDKVRKFVDYNDEFAIDPPNDVFEHVIKPNNGWRDVVNCVGACLCKACRVRCCATLVGKKV
ncbi:hypothetical protein ACKC5Q_23360, partial [Aeromonas dhakensis]|uniref:hypothetical protein n=1 Tax=Aeromonas dhakensis TaxID=196024 RepID=UPI0038B647F9